jgi:sterol desaturase/sphingolipid hydroxylase (fatty acid hydroxylase superfamily)
MPAELVFLLSLPTLFILFLLLEAAVPTGRKFPTIRGWRLVGALALAATLLVSALVPPLVLGLLPGLGGLDLAAAGAWGAIPAFLAANLLSYWAHRIQHRYDLLWRLLGHQLHHSVARVDVASTFIIHPGDVAVHAALSGVAAALLGVTPEASMIAGVIGFLAALYQHLNIRTPRWTGYLVQRPEAHMLHHQRGVHARNFGDLPLWDMMFGTFVNPERADVPVGFEPGRGGRVLAMLAGRDVNREAEEQERARVAM